MGFGSCLVGCVSFFLAFDDPDSTATVLNDRFHVYTWATGRRILSAWPLLYLQSSV